MQWQETIGESENVDRGRDGSNEQDEDTARDGILMRGVDSAYIDWILQVDMPVSCQTHGFLLWRRHTLIEAQKSKFMIEVLNVCGTAIRVSNKIISST